MIRWNSKLLALICVTPGWAAFLGFPPALAGNDGTVPKPAIAGAKSVAQPNALPSGAVATNAAVLQRRRLAIAQMLEGNIYYRTLFDVKLIDAKLAGPFPYEVRNSLFSSETHAEILYCVTAKTEFAGFHQATRPALIRVVHTNNGSERLVAKISNYAHWECRNANYGPFPELEQARAQRRKALGKSD